jgi:site-specific DNA-methyltransferase (adenine-specific)
VSLTPYYQHGGITIYHGDCREVLPEVRFGVDAVVTDPPYGHGQKWAGGTWATNPIYELAFKWDAHPVPLDLLLEVIGVARRSIVWGGNYYSLPPSRCWLSWIKAQSMPTMADFELAWTNLDRPAKAFKELRNPDGKREHPTQKPLSLMRWCIGFVPGDGAVLDPFMGSGTTLLAAKELNRRAIGIEIEERYCEIAARRLQQEVLPLEATA